MGNGMRVPGASGQTVYPISPKEAAMERSPWWLPFEPDAAVPVATTVIVDQVVAWRDFVCTRYGFTSESGGFPATAGRWKVQIQDIGVSQSFQPEAWNLTADIGGDFGTADNPSKDFPVPWVFMEKTTIRVTLENLSNFALTPHLLLMGYLTNWEREATAAQARNELTLKAMRIQAGEAAGW